MAPPDSLPQTKSVVSRVFSDVLSYSKLAGSIPDEDYSYNLAFPEFRKHVREESGQLIQLMGNCCRLLPKRRRLTLTSEESDNKTGAPLLTEEQRSAAMEALDSLLEHVDTVLDEVRGQRMNAEEQLSVSFGSALGDSGQALPDSRSGGRDALRLARVMRPQLTFSAPVDNSAKPFIPHYHDARGVRHTGKAGVHPFEKDIRVFQVPAEQMLPNETPYAPLAQSPFSFIDDREGLERAVQELLQVSEIAVDLEHHDFYSYQGFTCLMQISSRSADYIIDCLKIRDDMHLLAPVFLNPKTLKVLHGAREDIRWLQKDFGLYLINFFDTAVALQALHMPYSLAFAVDHFCQVKLQKQYQTADWRVRPIPAEMAHYAREDTHYLLYVYDRLKALLLNSEGRASVGNLLVHVYAESQRLSLDVYAKPTLDPQETYKLAMGRSLAGLNPSQEAVARAIFNWRDAAAREADDSPTAILHLSSVLSIASKLPTSARDVLKCCAPVSAVVRTKVAELVDLVKEAAGEAAMEAASLADGQAATEGASSSVGSLLRRTSIHRPRTGTLPSIEIPAHPPLPLTEKLAPLGAQKPSTWFGAMQRLSNIIAATPSIRVQMPGSLVVASLRQAAATKKTTTEARPTTAAPPPTSHKEEDEADEPIPAKSDAAAPAAAPVEPPMALPEEAIALRKVYGTGQSNRKRARKAS